MSDALRVLSPGLSCTVQDLGRLGFRRFGVPTSGAMDRFALQAGNLLVGNRRGAAALEMALLGPTLTATADLLVCVTGADLGAAVDGAAVPMWTSFPVREGSRIAFGNRGPARGVWTYLCVAGGIDAPLVMGSRSTYVRGSFGGLEGRAVRAGDVIRIPPSVEPRGRAGAALPSNLIPTGGQSLEARVIPGPQEEEFPSESLSRFYASTFTVSRQSDRMGYRLEAASPSAGPAGVPSEGTSPGCVQVPPDGHPIVLMADCQTTGGYAKIATIISADLAAVAQLAPGSRLRVRRVTLQEAREAAQREERILARLDAGLYDGDSA